MSGLFAIVPGAQAVLVKGGKYKQTTVYTRNGLLYAKEGNGYVRIMGQGDTTVPKMVCETLDVTDTANVTFGVDKRGNLAIDNSIDANQTKRMFGEASKLTIEHANGQLLIEQK